MTLRVLHAHTGNIFGGVETMLVGLARHAALAPGIAWRFALTSDGRLSNELATLGAAPIVVGAARASRPWTVWAARAQLARALRQTPADVGIVHSLWTLAVFGPVLRRMNVPVVLWVHGVGASPRWLMAWARRTVPDRVIANSRFTAQHAPLPFAMKATAVVYPPHVPPPGDPAARARLRAALGAGEHTVVLLQVARLEPAKGHRTLLEALPRVAGPWALWIAGGATQPGERAYETQLRRDLDSLGLAGRVRLLGERSDISDLLAAADIFVQPNQVAEGFGLALIEALTASKPIVATALGPTAEITGAEAARLTAPGDAAALARALESLIGDPAARRAMAAAGPAAARITDPAVVLPRLAETLREVAS